MAVFTSEIDNLFYDKVCEKFNLEKADTYLFKEKNDSGEEVELSVYVYEAVEKLLGHNAWLRSQKPKQTKLEKKVV